MTTDTFKTTLARAVEAVGQALPAGAEYKSLRDVVEEDCRHPNAAWRSVSEAIAVCPRCGVEGQYGFDYHLPPGRAARDLSTWLPGAIEGALLRALRQEWSWLGIAKERARFNTLVNVLVNMLKQDKDTRLMALEVVLDWLRGLRCS